MTVCFLDLDGVLVDFVGGVLREFDCPGFVVDHWDFDKTLSARLGIPVESFWDRLGEHFWALLGWTPDGRQVLELAEGRFGPENVFLLSSPCRTHGCLEGKRRWVRSHLPAYERRLFLGSAKHAFAGPQKVLVDDSDKNVSEFVKHGGFGALVPRPWNEFRHLAHAPVDSVAGFFNAL